MYSEVFSIFNIHVFYYTGSSYDLIFYHRRPLYCLIYRDFFTGSLASGMPKTTWCREHGISDKSFFYWQRILREEAYLTTLENTLTPAVKENSAPTTTDFIEIKMTDQVSSADSPFKPDVVIRNVSVSIEISNTATEELLNKVGGLLHA